MSDVGWILWEHYDLEQQEIEKRQLDPWSQTDKDKMEKKFAEFRRKIKNGSLRWDLDGNRTVHFDDTLKEQEYWSTRFEIEYNKLKDYRSGQDPQLVADIHAYVYYVTDFTLLGSDAYPDDNECLKLLNK